MTEEKVRDLKENLTLTIDRTHRHQGKKLLKMTSMEKHLSEILAYSISKMKKELHKHVGQSQ